MDVPAELRALFAGWEKPMVLEAGLAKGSSIITLLLHSIIQVNIFPLRGQISTEVRAFSTIFIISRRRGKVKKNSGPSL